MSRGNFIAEKRYGLSDFQSRSSRKRGTARVDSLVRRDFTVRFRLTFFRVESSSARSYRQQRAAL